MQETLQTKMETYQPLSEEEAFFFRRRMGKDTLFFLTECTKEPFKHSKVQQVLQQREVDNALYQEKKSQLTGKGPYDRTQEGENYIYCEEEWHTLTSYPIVINTQNLIEWLQIYYRPFRKNVPVNPARDIPPIDQIANSLLHTVPLLYMTKLYNLTYPNPLSPERKRGPPPPSALRDWYMSLPMNAEGNRRITRPISFLVTMNGQPRYWNGRAWGYGKTQAIMVNRYTRVIYTILGLPKTIVINDVDATDEEEYVCF